MNTRAASQGTLMVHLLGQCNLKCRHCYMNGGPSRREQLPLNAVLAAVGECEKLGIGTLYLTGGEPTLYRGLADVLGAASRVPGLDTVVCTNGTLMDDRYASLFQEMRARANVSIDGDETYHDFFRVSDGAFRAADRGVRKLVEAGISVSITATITQGNLDLVGKIAAWAVGAGVRKLRAQPLLKLGRGSDIADKRLTSAQLNQLILQLSDLGNRYRESGLDCGIIGSSRRFLQAHPCGAYVCNGAGCHRRVAREIKKIVIREDGTVLPEITNLSPNFALGKITDGPLSSLVSRYFASGYEKFDQLCRSIYAEIIPSWEDAVVPWDQIVAERSYSWIPKPEGCVSPSACGTCAPVPN